MLILVSTRLMIWMLFWSWLNFCVRSLPTCSPTCSCFSTCRDSCQAARLPRPRRATQIMRTSSAQPWRQNGDPRDHDDCAVRVG